MNSAMSRNQKPKIVTIDGPSGVGKSTISRRVAANLSYTYLDTGAMYRAVGLKLKESKIDLEDDSAVRRCLDTVSLKLLPATDDSDDVGVMLDGRDVSNEIRSPEMAMVASAVSALPVVREKLTLMQQEIGRGGKIVAEGRDTGTVVFPDAAWKFYLEAAPKIRMHRRAEQLRAQGEQVDEAELLAMIIKRDHDDQNRSIAPLSKAVDAHVIDTGVLNIDEVTKAMLVLISEGTLRQ
jgi:CMP/dCMP kinase